MRHFRKVIISLFSIFIIFYSFPAYSQQEFPKPVGYVNDFANVIPQDIKNSLDRLILEVKQKTGAEIVVVTLNSVGKFYTPQEYANLLFENWGIGEKGKDNGVLVLNSINDRYIWIEVGYGLEGILPDGLVGEIRDKYFMPFLQKGDYGTAYLTGVAAIAGVIAKDAGVTIDGTITVDRSRPPRKRDRGVGIGNLFWLILMFLFFSGIFGRRRRSLLFWGPWFFGGFGGGFGGGSGGGFGGGFGGFGGGASGGGGAGGSY
jgi:uncharacterized protein